MFSLAGVEWVLGNLMRDERALHVSTCTTTCCIALDSPVRRSGLVHCFDEGCNVDFTRVTVTHYNYYLSEGIYNGLARKKCYPPHMG